jgi:hypothetical protein
MGSRLRLGAAANHDGRITRGFGTGAGAIAVSQRDVDRIIPRLGSARHLFHQVSARIYTKAGIGPGPRSARLRLDGDRTGVAVVPEYVLVRQDGYVTTDLSMPSRNDHALRYGGSRWWAGLENGG